MRRLALAIALAVLALSGAAWWFYLSDTPWEAALTGAIIPQEHGIRMEKFALRDTQRQQTRWEILADIAQVDPQANTTTLEGVHLIGSTPGTWGVARRAIHAESRPSASR